MNEETMIALQKCIKKYFKYEEIARITKEPINATNKEYFGICLGSCNCDYCNWTNLIYRVEEFKNMKEAADMAANIEI
jgi:hypothetical protein